MQNQNLIEEYTNEFISYLLDEGYASDTKSAVAIYESMSDDWFYGVLDELNRYAKETGKSFRTKRPTSSGGKYGDDSVNSQVMRSVLKGMGSGRPGAAGRGKKKVPGRKPPAAGEYGSERRSPAQEVENRRRRRKESEEMQRSRFD